MTDLFDMMSDQEDEIEEAEEKPKAKPKPKTKTKPKSKPKKKSGFNISEHPILILLWGTDGTSKSEQIMKFKPAPLIIDLENKLHTLAAKLGFPEENIITASRYNEFYDLDGIETLEEIRDAITHIRKNIKTQDITSIALDGISDVRPFAVKEWLAETGRENPVTAGDWRDINDKVRDICTRLINMGRAEKINIFFTAQMGGKYVKNVMVEEIPDCKSWISHNCDHKFKMIRDDEKRKFFAYCEKSYFDPFFTIDITDFKHDKIPSLMNLLQVPEELKKYIEQYDEDSEAEDSSML